MPRNPDLVPTVIADINGVTKTVHKKPVRPSTALKAPAPATTAPSKEELVQGTLNLIEEAMGTLNGEPQFKAWEALSSWYKQPYLEDLSAYLTGDPVIAKGVAQQIIDSEYENVINETVHFYPLLGIEDYSEAKALIRMMGQYEALEIHSDLSKASPEVQEQCLAIMKATRIIAAQSKTPQTDHDYPLDRMSNKDSVWDYFIIKDQDLVALLMERHKDAERIAMVVSQHRTTAPNEILGIMDGILPALAEGNL